MQETPFYLSSRIKAAGAKNGPKRATIISWKPVRPTRYPNTTWKQPSPTGTPRPRITTNGNISFQLYNQLVILEYSPITALNRTFAFAKVHGHQQAIPEAEKLGLEDMNFYHSPLGYLYTGVNTAKAIEHYQKAITLTRPAAEKRTLAKEIERLRAGHKKSPSAKDGERKK